METVLNPRKYLRVALKYSNNLRIRLLHEADGFCQLLGPLCEARAMVGRTKEDYPSGALKNTLQMSFRSLLRCYQGL
jgi:hypothetical protein